MVKVDIISGFLGAGKTTLIKKIFESVLKKEKVVLIENEFGEIGIDGTFLKDSGIQIKEINAGCICCSLVGDFEKSMKEVLKLNPERIIIEPSGVGKLSDIVNAVLKLKEELSVNIIATVVDGPKTKMYLKNFGEFFNNQVEAANTIVISKTDKMTEDKVLEVVNLVKEKNDHATIITTAIQDLDSEQLVKVLEEKISLKEDLQALMTKVSEEDEDECDDPDCCCHHHHHHDEDDHDEDEDEHECCHHHHHDEDDHDEDEDEHECCHHHHHDEENHDEDEDEHECCHHHHHDEDDHDEDEDEHECCHHHHHDEEDHDEDEDEHEEHEHHHHHHHHHDADEVFTSWGVETPKSVSHAELDEFLKALASDESLGIIVRSKGILKASDNEKWYYYDYVSGDYEIRLGEPDYSGRVVVIGSHIDEHKIENLFFKKGE